MTKIIDKDFIINKVAILSTEAVLNKISSNLYD